MAERGRPRAGFRAACWIAAACGLLHALESAHAQETEPFDARNLSPPVAILGLPVWQVPDERHRVALTSELANHYRLSQRGDDVLVLDGETWRTRLRYTGRIGPRWSIGLEVPYYRHAGGFLDRLIDGWHSAFNMPDGGRDLRDEGELLFQMAAGGPLAYHLDRSRQGWGDAQLHAARRVGEEGRYIVRGTVKLATGEEDMLAGSGSTSAGLTLLRPQRLLFRARPAGFFWGGGLLVPGTARAVPFEQKDAGLVAVAGGSWKIWPRFGLKAQLDYHSAFYDTPLEELGEPSVQVTFGGWRQLGQRGVLEFAINEDLNVSSSPDLVLHFGVTWRW